MKKIIWVYTDTLTIKKEIDFKETVGMISTLTTIIQTKKKF